MAVRQPQTDWRTELSDPEHPVWDAVAVTGRDVLLNRLRGSLRGDDPAALIRELAHMVAFRDFHGPDAL